MVLKEFDSIATLNKKILIWYFWDSLYFSIRAQLNERRRDLNTWDKVIKKAIDVKAKASQQLSSDIQEIVAQCPRGPKIVKNEEKPVKLAKSSYKFFTNLENHSRRFFLGQRQGQDQALVLSLLLKTFRFC